jgi:hypothetical protein
MRPPIEQELAAVHESGHCVAARQAFATASWLPRPMPSPIIRYVEITQTPSGWTGVCVAKCVYSTRGPDCIAPRYRDLMERQILVKLSGGIAESVYRGVRLPKGDIGDSPQSPVSADHTNGTLVLWFGDQRPWSA